MHDRPCFKRSIQGLTMPIKTDRYRKHLEAGLTIAETAELEGVEKPAVAAWARRQGVKFASRYPDKAQEFPRRGGTIDIALTAAFRSVIGYCPFNDGAKAYAPKPLPKRLIMLERYPYPLN